MMITITILIIITIDVLPMMGIKMMIIIYLNKVVSF